MYRGLIGARTRYSTGQGTVEEYARAAQAAGLDFVVFLEEFGKKGGLTCARAAARRGRKTRFRSVRIGPSNYRQARRRW